MLIRSIGGIVRGKATPLQLFLAAILGSVLGFVPSWTQSPGLVLALLLLLILLNANLVLAAIIGGVAKLVSLALMPISFAIGRVLLDGPGQPVFKGLINAPGTAYFGLEYYATAGGVVSGLAFGLVCAVLVQRTVGGFRRRMAALEEGSEAYKRWSSKRSVRLLAFVFLGGGRGKATYKELLARRVGLPIRPLGVVFVALVVGLAAIIMAFAGEPITTALARYALERANGATVDLDAAKLDWSVGKLRLTGLAVADPDALATDRLRASMVEGDISTGDLLRKRVTLDRVVLSDARTGEKRTVPGILLRPRPETPPSPPPAGTSEKTLKDYIREAELWKERLAKLREWLEMIDRKRPAQGAGSGDGEIPAEGGRRETLRERLEREVREKGYTKVAASHLVEGAPTVLVRELVVEGLRTPDLGGQILDVRAENISTHPWLVAEPPRVVAQSKDGRFDAEVTVGSLATGGGAGALRFSYTGIPADLAVSQLGFGGERPLQGGTVDLAADGRFEGATVELPLRITVRDTVVTIPAAGSAPVEELVIPAELSGRVDDPRITVEQKAFTDALAKAGADQLASRLRGEADKLVEKAKNEAAKKLGDEAKEKLGGLLDRLQDKDERR